MRPSSTKSSPSSGSITLVSASSISSSSGVSDIYPSVARAVWGRFPRIVTFCEDRTILTCSGDEDRATQSLRRPALSRALASQRNLLVDLTELSFADASLMVDLAMVARRLRQAGSRMTLRGAQPQIQRLIELVGLDRLPGVSAEWPALA